MQAEYSTGSPGSIEKLKATLTEFKFVSPLPRRSPRNLTVKTETQDEDTGLPSFSVMGSKRRKTKTKKEIKDELEPQLYTSPDTPKPIPSSRKRTVGKELSQSSSSKRLKRGYAPPEQYAHLNFLQDYLRENLDVVFCGINPGKKSAEVGHHFANPTNHFWKALHLSGMTDRLLPPAEDFTLPEQYNYGMTNLVDRPSAEEAELSKEDKVAGVPILLGKIARFQPLIVCFVGKGIWEVFLKEAMKMVSLSPNQTIPSLDENPAAESASSGSATPLAGQTSDMDAKPESSSQTNLTEGSKQPKKKLSSKRKGKKISKFEWGIQPCKVVHQTNSSLPSKETLFFVMPSSSARVVSHQLPDKVKLFEVLKERVEDIKNHRIDTKDMVIFPTTPTS
ncbi:Uracil DNA glycosylase family 2 [Abortiporus biennis]